MCRLAGTSKDFTGLGANIGYKFQVRAKMPKVQARMRSLLQNGEKITPKQWKAEIQSLQAEYDSIGKKQTKTATELAYAEVIGYNKKNLKGSFRTRADSRTGNRAERNGGRKKFNVNFIVNRSVFLYN